MSDYIVHDSSLTAVADAIRTQTGRSGALEFPTQFTSEINSLALKRGVLRHDAELIHTVSYDQMLVADEGVTIPEYTSTHTNLIASENIEPTIAIDPEQYDYRIVHRYVSIPIYEEPVTMGHYWIEYCLGGMICDICYILPGDFPAIYADLSNGNRNATATTRSIGRTVLRNSVGSAVNADTNLLYGPRMSFVTPALVPSTGVLTLKTPNIHIRGTAAAYPKACWESTVDVRNQYIIEVYRVKKGNLNFDGWGITQELSQVIDCVNSADHKLR